MCERLPILAALLLVSGCGSEDPKRSRLSAGDQVIIAGQLGSRVLAQPPLSEGLLPENGGKGNAFLTVPAGTRARVDADTGEEKDANRNVTVTVLQGDYSLKTLRVARKDIRPAR